MAVPRHNAHMKIAQHIWDRAKTCAILAGQSMTEFTEDALVAMCEAKRGEENDANDATDRDVSEPAD